MSKPTRHHIVPKCYLKSFTNTSGTLYVFPKAKEKKAYEAVPNNVAVRRHYYSIETESGELDPKVEHTLSELESIAEPILSDIKSHKDITTQQKQDLSVFIGIMHSRNPNFRSGVEEFMRQNIEKIKESIIRHSKDTDDIIADTPEVIVALAGGKHKLKDWMIQNLKVVMTNNASIEHIGLGITISEILQKMHWKFIINDIPNMHFITSDNPCYTVNSGANRVGYGVGIALKDSTLHFPISPNVFLIASHGDDSIKFVTLQDKIKITRINSRTVRHAESEIYSSYKNKWIEQIHKKNKGFYFATLIQNIGPYQLMRRRLIKKA